MLTHINTDYTFFVLIPRNALNVVKDDLIAKVDELTRYLYFLIIKLLKFT